MLIAVYSDEERYRSTMASLIEGQGHRVAEAASPEEALALARSAKPHLLVACNAGGRALDLIRRVRAEATLAGLPVLCIDPQAGAAETVAMLDAGADDAIARPFQPPIFLARVRTLLRRASWSGAAQEESATVLSGGPVELRLLSRQALAGGKPVELTRLEFDLLAEFLRHPDRAFKREELLAAVWNYPDGVATRTLDKHVESLRRKLPGCADLLQTVHGVGYRFSPVQTPAPKRR